MSDYALVLPFETDSPDFALGVEVGMLWAQLRDAPPYGDEELTAHVHVANAEMVLRIAESLGFHVRADEVADGWLVAHFSVVAS